MGEGTHRYGKMEWVFYIIILPLLFTALLSGVILQFLGFDITGKIASSFKSLTGLHQTVQSTSGKSSDPTKQLQASQDQVKTLQQTKQQLEDSLAQKNSQIDSLQKQINSLKSGNQTHANGSSNGQDTSGPSGNANAGNDSASDNGSTSAADPLQAQADIYAQMSAGKAAAILGNLPVTEARAVLSKMTSDQEAAILQKMDPVVAGKILSSQ